MQKPDFGKTLRHWDPNSESYSGADSLLGALEDGWQMSKAVSCQKLNYAGRPVTIYHVELSRYDSTTCMQIIGNPFIVRYITHMGCTLHTRDERVETLPYIELQKMAS